jgi:hypothetical protein
MGSTSSIFSNILSELDPLNWFSSTDFVEIGVVLVTVLFVYKLLDGLTGGFINFIL